MKKIFIAIIASTIAFTIVATGIFYANIAEAKPIWLTVDVYTSKGGQGEGVAGGSYRTGEQIVVYFTSSYECQAKLTITGPGGTTVRQMSLPTNRAQSLSLGTASQSHVGTWRAVLECLDYNKPTDSTTFAVVGDTVRDVEVRPIWLTVDVYTSKGGQGEGVAGGSYKPGEQVILYVLSSYECQAKLTVTGPDGSAKQVPLSLPTNKVQNLSLGTADESDAGTWKIVLEGLEFNKPTDITNFTVSGSVSPQAPSTIIIPPVSPTPTQPAPTIPTAPSTQPTPTAPTTPSTATTGGAVPITVDAVTASELLALLAMKVNDGKFTSDPGLDADNNGKVNMEDARLFLRQAVNKK